MRHDGVEWDGDIIEYILVRVVLDLVLFPTGEVLQGEVGLVVLRS